MFEWTASDDLEQEQNFALEAEEHERQLKTQFAEALLRNEKSVFEIACELAEGNFKYIDKISKTWPVDDFVLEEKQRLLDEFGAEHFQPTVHDFAAEIWVRMRSTQDAKEYKELAELYAKTRGFIKKPDTVISPTVNVAVQHVMEVPITISNVDDWESVAAKQQSKLIEQSRHALNRPN